MKKLLQASVHNWGMICITQGDWLRTTWTIYDNGKYQIVTENGIKRTDQEIKAIADSHKTELLLETAKETITGKMSAAGFNKLRDGIFNDPWLDPEIETHGWDGVTWDIEQYAPDGTLERSTGDSIYIYGHRNLENLVNLLPRQDKRNGSDGYISVRTKQQQEKNT